MPYDERMNILLLVFCIIPIFTFSLNALDTLRVESIKELYEANMSLAVYDSDCKFAPVLIVQTEMDATTQENISWEKGAEQSQSNYSEESTEEMVFVQGSTFQMGSNDGEENEKPIHSVTVSDFYIGKYEVTVAEFKKFITITGYKTDAEQEGYSYVYEDDGSWERKNGVTWKCDVKGNSRSTSDNNHPVVHVSWNDADAYCKWAGGRLPTEAEWEYASRGGSKSKGYKYSGSNTIDDVAWYDDNSGKKTHPVGTKQPNELGIYDMSGNVCEWCNDWYDKNYYNESPTSNPKGPDSGNTRILRGGSLYHYDDYCLVANREPFPSFSDFNKGFRIARPVE